MAFRRGAKAQQKKLPPPLTAETVPNNSSSTSPTRPLLVAAGDDAQQETTIADGARIMMMNEGSTPNASLVQHDMTGDLESSPYLNAATFEPTADELVEIKKSRQRWNAVVFGVGVGAFFFALFSMALYTSGFIVFCFAFPTVLGPYMVHQRRFLNRFPTLRRLINRLRFQVNRLQVQNNMFASENTRLESEIAGLQQLEFQLHQICQKQGSSITEMQKLIKENGAIQKEMKKLQDSAELQQLLQAILVSDTNMDFEWSEAEIHRLTLRLKSFSVVDEEKLKQALRLCSSTTNVNGDLFKVHQEERDLEIATPGAFTGVEGWMV